MTDLTIRGKSPANPSRSAIKRVLAPLPAPTTCPYCGGPVHLVTNDQIYGSLHGEWPWAYMCKPCNAYVGLHKFTAIPLGTLANREVREARKLAKAAFSALWLRCDKRMTQKEAYAWLAAQLGIADVNACHVGWFDAEQCYRVVAVVAAYEEA